jgi:thymidylate synthase (FAD)
MDNPQRKNRSKKEIFEMSKVRMVAVTQPLITKDGVEASYEPTQMVPMGPNDFIAYCARVSNPANQNNTETSEKLLKYLVRNKHWSPFEMVSITMEIETTRDIGRQILRHRSFSFQEFSQRYAAVVDMSPPREARLQDTKNRQNSIETDDERFQKDWNVIQKTVTDAASNAYKWALDNGIAKEQARVVLPEGLTMSRMYMSGTLRSWIHYCELRTNKYIDKDGRLVIGTQKEHYEIAKQCWELIEYQFPALKNLFTQ